MVAQVTKLHAGISYTGSVASVSYVSTQAGILLRYDSLNRNLSEALSVAELASLGITNNLTDTATVAESAAISVTQSLANAATVLDSFAAVVAYTRTFSDIITLIDDETNTDVVGPVINSAALNAQPLLGESGRITTVRISISKDEAQDVTEQDLATVADVFVASIGQGLSESLTAADAISADISNLLTETIGIGDGVSIVFRTPTVINGSVFNALTIGY